MERDNAAVRMSFASEIYEKGVIHEKERLLSLLPEKYSSLHREGDIHIHDLESFGKTYKSNRDIPIDLIMDKLKRSVALGGYLYMDYMMPLQDSHIWKAPHFFRTREISNFFDHDWKIHYIIEMRNPVFEAAHVDRPEEHFHRFGYILAQKIK